MEILPSLEPANSQKKSRWEIAHASAICLIFSEDSCPRKLQGFSLWKWSPLGDHNVRILVLTKAFRPKNPQISYTKILNDKLPIDNQKRSINMKSGILGGPFLFFVAENFYSFGSVSNLKMMVHDFQGGFFDSELVGVFKPIETCLSNWIRGSKPLNP